MSGIAGESCDLCWCVAFAVLSTYLNGFEVVTGLPAFIVRRGSHVTVAAALSIRFVRLHSFMPCALCEA